LTWGSAPHPGEVARAAHRPRLRSLACARGCARLSRGHRLRNEFFYVRFLRALQLLKTPLKHDLSVLEDDEIDVDQTERVSSAAPAYAAVTVPFGPLRGDDLGCVQVVGHEHGGRPLEVAELDHELQDRALRDRVEAGRWLVVQNDRRAPD